MALVATASQTIGPFFREAMQRPAWSDLARDGAHGTRVRIEGAVLDGDRAAVSDALLEVWQPNSAGHFAHPEDRRTGRLDPHFHGFGRACTDPGGRYWFVTVVPGSVPAADDTPQAPHLNVSIFARGLLKRLVTRIYFADHTDQHARDPLLNAITDETARRTLIAARMGDVGGIATYCFDIVLQGDGETVFLAV